jgi:hypothetical protein
LMASAVASPSCRLFLLLCSAAQVLHQRSQAVRPQRDIGAGWADLHPRDEKLHDAGLLGRK